MNTTTSPTANPEKRQGLPHAFWAILALARLHLFLPGFADSTRAHGASASTGWQGIVFSVVLTGACFWSFARCPSRVVFVKLLTLLCLLAALYLAVDNAVNFLTVRGHQ